MLIYNKGSQDNHLSVIKQQFKRAEKIYIMSAFLRNSGLDLILDDLKFALGKRVDISIAIGLDMCITEPDSLLELHRLSEKYANLKLYIYSDDKKDVFHPKMYCFISKSLLTLLVGSANLTGGGLKNNFEISFLSEADLKSKESSLILDYILTCFNSEKFERSSYLTITKYQNKYKTFKHHVSRANRKAEKELEVYPELNKKTIKKYLEEYLNDNPDALDFHSTQYDEAQKVLNKIARTENITKIEFKSLYEKLVGGKDISNEKLWTSGYIFRGKTGALNNYKKTQKLIIEIENNREKSSKDLFELALNLSRNIPRLGVNIITEIMHTYDQNRFGVLNKNSRQALIDLGINFNFPVPKDFKGHHYELFNNILLEVSSHCGFKSLRNLDKFLSHIYWSNKD